MTATKISPISIHKLRSYNLQYKNNKNKNINQLDNYANNNNDIPPKNYQPTAQYPNKKYGTISNSHTKTKNTQSVSKTTITITTKHMVDKSNTNTSKKHTNKNIPNELINFQRHKNNNSTLQYSKINADKEKKIKSTE